MVSCYLYAKVKGSKVFRAFDISRGCCVSNLMYATVMPDTEEMKETLQSASEWCRGLGIVFQMRTDKGKVIFQTT